MPKKANKISHDCESWFMIKNPDDKNYITYYRVINDTDVFAIEVDKEDVNNAYRCNLDTFWLKNDHLQNQPLEHPTDDSIALQLCNVMEQCLGITIIH